MTNCLGPCLKHCYNRYNTIIFIFGMVIGYLLKYIVDKKNN